VPGAYVERDHTLPVRAKGAIVSEVIAAADEVNVWWAIRQRRPRFDLTPPKV